MTVELDATTGKLIEVISCATGARKHRIHPSSRLEQDLGITGDSLVDAIDLVFGLFRIDAGDFVYKDYIASEGLGLLGPGGKLPRPKPLTVAMLAQAIRDGRWSSTKLDGIAAE